jgi:hypothetical protein
MSRKNSRYEWNVLVRVFAPRAWAGAAIAPPRGAAVAIKMILENRSM